MITETDAVAEITGLAQEFARKHPKLLEHELAEMVYRHVSKEVWSAAANLWGRERLEDEAAEARAHASNERSAASQARPKRTPE